MNARALTEEEPRTAATIAAKALDVIDGIGQSVDGITGTFVLPGDPATRRTVADLAFQVQRLAFQVAELAQHVDQIAPVPAEIVEDSETRTDWIAAIDRIHDRWHDYYTTAALGSQRELSAAIHDAKALANEHRPKD